MFKALREIIAKSFSDTNIRMSRAAYWYATIVVLLIILLIMSIELYIIYTYRYSDFIKDLYGILIVCNFIFGLPLGFWLFVMAARRIRDAGFRARWYYIYNAISAPVLIAYYLTLTSGKDTQIYESLSIFMSLINFVILIILLLPTSHDAEILFGKAIEYKHDILREFKILSISVGVILLCIGIFFGIRGLLKRDGCYLHSGFIPSYLGDIKDEYGENIIEQIKYHFNFTIPNHIYNEGVGVIPSLPLLDFSTLTNKSKEELNGTLQCYYNAKPTFSAELKDGKFNGKVKIYNNINLEFENGIIKDSVLERKIYKFNEEYTEKREYKNGYLRKISFTPEHNNNFEAFEVYYDKGLISKDVELVNNGKKLYIPHKYGVRFGMMKNGDESCFVFGDAYGCRARIEYYNDNGKITTKYFDRYNKPTGEEKAKDSSHILLYYNNGELIQAIDKSYIKATYVFRDNRLQGVIYEDRISIFDDYGSVEVIKRDDDDETDRLQRAYNKIAALPKERIHTLQKDGKTLYVPQNRNELLSLIVDENIKLDSIDTSNIKDMGYLFSYRNVKDETRPIDIIWANRKDFSGIESWDTSNVENMRGMFYEAENFNQNINSWNVSKVKNMSNMFSNSQFNKPLDKWDTRSLEDSSFMFADNYDFNQNINSWNVSKVKDMSGMFKEAKSFNQSLDKWNTSNVKDMSEMFYKARNFNQNINSWNVSKVKDMSDMFYDAKSFNQPLYKWNVSNVKDMKRMFDWATSFNQPLDKWDTSNVENMHKMFSFAKSFNQPLNSWNVSKVNDMSDMFASAKSFNQNINSWNVSRVVNMEGMFANTESFNKPLDKWDTSNVISMNGMFANAESFNQPLNSWNVSRVKYMSDMFNGAKSFKQNLESWGEKLSKDCNIGSMFNSSPLESNPPKWYRERMK